MKNLALGVWVVHKLIAFKMVHFFCVCVGFGLLDFCLHYRKDITEETVDGYFAKIVYSLTVIVCFHQDSKLGIGPLSWAIYWGQTNGLGKDVTQSKLNTWLWCMRIINLLTVYLVCKHFPINHPVWHVEDILGQFPRWLLIGKEDGLPGDPKAHQHHQHNDDKVHHIYHLEGQRRRNKRKNHVIEGACECRHWRNPRLRGQVDYWSWCLPAKHWWQLLKAFFFFKQVHEWWSSSFLCMSMKYIYS